MMPFTNEDHCCSSMGLALILEYFLAKKKLALIEFHLGNKLMIDFLIKLNHF
jgi:hypothetical protein